MASWRMWLPSLLFVAVAVEAGGGSCGAGSIPFRFEVSTEGQPVLGCAIPACFGHGKGGEGYSVFTDNVFMREGDGQKKRHRSPNAHSEMARCPSSTDSSTCAATMTWVGGFEYDDNDLRLQCCRYDGLKFAAEVGRPVVHPGEVYSGGEVIRDGRQTAFDLISNVRRIDNENGGYAFELTVARMNCLPDPPEEFNSVEINQQTDISRILDKVAGDAPPDPPASTASPPAPPPSDDVGLPSNIADQVNSNNVVDTDDARGYQPPPAQGGQGYAAPGGGQNYAQGQQNYAGGENYVQGGEQGGSSNGYYYPVSRCDWCADMEVDTPNGRRRMDDIRIGDEVATVTEGVVSFTRFSSWLHRLPQQKAHFIRVLTNGGEVIELTPQHFIYKSRCHDSSFHPRLVYAEALRVGDCVFVADESGAVTKQRVNSTSVIEREGAFSPMTESGDLIVNGVFASCHNVFKAGTASQSVLEASSSLEWFLSSLLPSSLFSLISSETGHVSPSVEFLFSVAGDIIPLKPIIDDYVF